MGWRCMTHTHTAAKKKEILGSVHWAICKCVRVPVREVDATAWFTSEVCDRL